MIAFISNIICIFAEEIANSKYNVMGCLVNNDYQSLDYELKEDAKIEFIDMSDKEGMKIYRRSLIFILGKAFGEIYPEALLTVNYQLSHSMFCEIDNMEVTDEIIEKVTNKMKEIVAKKKKKKKRIMNTKIYLLYIKMNQKKKAEKILKKMKMLF